MHLTEGTLELLAMNRLLEPELAPAEEHLLQCEECRERWATVDWYVAVMKASLRCGAPEVVFWQLHGTEDGPVQVWVEKTRRGWISRRMGPQLNGGFETGNKTAAILDAMQSFAELFPEHRCGRACLKTPAAINTNEYNQEP